MRPFARFSLPLAALGLLAALPAPAQIVYTMPNASASNGYPQQGRARRGRNNPNYNNPNYNNPSYNNPSYNNPNYRYNRNGAGAQNSGNRTNAKTNTAVPKGPKLLPPGPVDNEDSVNTAPAVSAGGVLYFGSWNHEVTALDESTGAVKWKFTAGDIINASPAVGPDGAVYVTCRDKNVYALDGKTGAKLWQFATAGRLATRPAVAGGMVYVGTSDKDRKVVALDAKTGAKKWEQATQTAASSPAVGPGGLVYVSAGRLYALDGATGAIKWSEDLNVLPAQAPTVSPAGTVYVGTADAKLLALDGTSGKTLWQFDTGDSMDYPVVLGPDDTLYASARKLFALRTNGKERWERAGNGTAWSAPAVGENGVLYTGYSDSKVYALDAATGGTKWAFATNDGLICFPALGTASAVYFQCEGDSKVYALNRQTGRALWTAAQDPTQGPVRPAAARVKK